MKNLTSTQTLRTDLTDQLTALMTGLGYTVTPKLGDLQVAKNGLRIGRVDISAYAIPRNDTQVATGQVQFTPALHDARRCEYKLDATGELKLDSLIARLRATAAACDLRAKRAAAAQAREDADNELLRSIAGAAEDEVSYGTVTLGDAKLSVFDGKVDIKLTQLTPEVATKVLEALGLR
jgi:hypothetical protein